MRSDVLKFIPFTTTVAGVLSAVESGEKLVKLTVEFIDETLNLNEKETRKNRTHQQ